MAADKGHVFARSGPTHLPAIDWTNEPHRRSIAASLVQACYILQHDRKNNRQGPEAYAPPWWEFFHFELLFEILDESDIFGAIFKYNPPSEGCKHVKAHNSPKYAIAFRGTILSGSRDIILDLKAIINRLQTTKRSAIALIKVHDFVEAHESANIWITGHSLGSSIGMYVGKHMAKDRGVLLKTYLFNPPFISLSLEWIKDAELKDLISEARNLTRAGIDKTRIGKRQAESFDRLSAWVPSLFVHAADPICSGYISYFQELEKLRKTIGGSNFQRNYMKVSTLAEFFNVVNSIVGKDLDDPEPLHLLPSASVTRNLSYSSFPYSHRLDQWWKADLDMQSQTYGFDS